LHLKVFCCAPGEGFLELAHHAANAHVIR